MLWFFTLWQKAEAISTFFPPSKVRNMFFPRRGRPGSGDAEPVIAADIHWAFFFHPFVWVCTFPHTPINVSVFAVVYKGLCAVTFSPPSWIFIRSGSWSLTVAGDLPLYIPDPVLSELIPNAWEHTVSFRKHVRRTKRALLPFPRIYQPVNGQLCLRL